MGNDQRAINAGDEKGDDGNGLGRLKSAGMCAKLAACPLGHLRLAAGSGIRAWPTFFRVTFFVASRKASGRRAA